MIKNERIVLSDKTISDPSLIGFIETCFHETGGCGIVAEDLAGIGYKDLCDAAYDYNDTLKRTGDMDLQPYTSQDLKIFILSIVSSLEDHKHLDDGGLFINMKFSEALDLIRSI